MAYAPQAKPNRFYRKPKPETMKKNREFYKEAFKEEISWIKDNLQDLTQNKHKFLIEMYTILITGSRKVTPKMATAIKSSIIKCKGDPRYNETVRKMEEVRLEPILGSMACDCIGYRYHKDCKHIKEINENSNN